MTRKEKAMKKKLYPFAIAKHDHDFKLRIRVLLNAIYDGELSSDKHDRCQEEVNDLIRIKQAAWGSSKNGRVGYLKGADISKAKKVIAWADNYRRDKNALEGAAYAS